MLSHERNISVVITLASAPATVKGFGNVLGLFDGISLDGDRVRTYSSLSAVEADEGAGFLNAAALAAATVMFSQIPAPKKIKIGKVDTGGGESYSDALALVEAADDDFYGVFIDDRTLVVIEPFATTVQAKRYIFAFQSADAGWLTTGTPSAILQGDERSFGIYHDTDTEWADAAALANRLAFDPDTRSAPWDCPLKAVAAYATAISETQLGFLEANRMNVGLPYAGETFFIDAGVNQNNRPLYEIVTMDWFFFRLRERVAKAKVDASAKGTKIPVTAVGQSLILAIANGLLSQGVKADHFAPDNVEAVAEEITSADLAAQKIRISGRAQIAVSARLFDFTFDFGTDPL